MKKFLVKVPLDYISGYLRYGHYEVKMEAESLEDLKKYINSEDGEEYIKDFGFIEVDDYELSDYGNLDLSDVTIEEIEK